MRPTRHVVSSARIVARVEALLAKFPDGSSAELRGLTLGAWLEAAEAWRIAKALEEARGNRTQAARSLEIARRTLYKRMEKLGIDPPRHGRESSKPSLRAVPRQLEGPTSVLG